ncbi:MAG: LysR substrate-binding domain-containing protein [Pseudomonadales bacterium]
MTKSYTKVRYQRLPAQQSVRVFEAAARHLSFTAAAQELSMTQSGVSKQIKGLEDFLGECLFARHGQRITLSSAGRAFYTRCEQALDSLQQGVDEMQGESGTLRLQAPPTFAARWLIPRMEVLKESLPKLDLHIETTWLRTIRDRVRPKSNEMVIHACIHYPFDEIEAQLLRRETLLVVVSPDYMVRRGTISQPSDLVGKDLIHTRLDGHIHWEAWARTLGVEALDTDSGYEFETLDMALSAAESGIGVLVCDALYALPALASGRLVVPFTMPLISGLQYLLLMNPDTRYWGLQENYRLWLARQITQDHRKMEALLCTLGLNLDDLHQADWPLT